MRRLRALLLAVALAPAAAGAADIVATLRDYGRFDAFLAVVEQAGMTGALATGGPWTVFAPERVAPALVPRTGEAAAALVRRHLLPGRVSLRALARERPRRTAAGHRLRFVDMSGAVLVEDRWVLRGDIDADNGLVHIIDEAIAPLR